MAGANLPLGFAALAVGAIAITAGLTGDTWADVVQGKSGKLRESLQTAASADQAVGDSTYGSLGVDRSETSGGGFVPNNLQGFKAQPGTDFSRGAGPQIAARLAALGRKLHGTIYGISGYRSSSHNASVGGAPGSKHLTGDAADVGLNSPTRDSFARVTDAQLRSVGLYRPVPGDPREINHVALLPGFR